VWGDKRGDDARAAAAIVLGHPYEIGDARACARVLEGDGEGRGTGATVQAAQRRHSSAADADANVGPGRRADEVLGRRSPWGQQPGKTLGVDAMPCVVHAQRLGDALRLGFVAGFPICDEPGGGTLKWLHAVPSPAAHAPLVMKLFECMGGKSILILALVRPHRETSMSLCHARPPIVHCESLAHMPIRLDAIDWRILKELQADGRITNVALAAKVGLSAPPCLRRVRALEEAGLINGYTVLLDEAALGFSLTAFAMVGLHNQAEADLRAFENAVIGWAIVREAYMLSGESDFMLKCVAADLTQFQSFVLNDLTAAPNVASVKTFLTIRRAKRAPGVPMSERE
jgi:DNA-binding Lrp family transcriptional regulator